MPAQHHQSRKLIDWGIFDNVNSFRELEDRIGGLPTTKDVGDAFEIFVEGYLATQKIMQAEQVWPVGQIPFEIRCKMNLPANTKGVDGLFRTVLGQLVPYQVKFRTLAEPLTYTEVSSFLGLTERARDRVIFTNARDVARDAKTRDAIRTVRAQDFCRLTPGDFLLIENWLKRIPVDPVRRVARPYQQEAIERIIETFRTADRATTVMACGSGKTLVALWVAEQMRVRRIIVFVPSLALLSQTLKEWSRWTIWGNSYQYLCVCSDPTVSQGVDEFRLDQIDTEFPISTDHEEVRRFLRSNGKGIQVIFSTYQSAPVIMKGSKGLGPFDLAVLDEAHKTTGMQGGAFALPLLDKKIQVKKRLFLTATPRHYDIRHRDRAGDFRVISMDNQALYGPVSYRLTFAQAAKKGIICNYKVVVSVVDGEEVTEFALAHGITLIDKNEIAVRWVAHQLALKKAIHRVKATRIITFHSTVRLAQRFASSDVGGITRHLNRFSVYHVNGGQPSAEREDQLTAFRNAKRGVITNARCLTEGVDVPGVDMIAFMSPRKSRVDIAQATGRAMRKAGPQKTFGFVVVPLFLNQHRGESLEEALERSDFEEVADVLNAMQEQDTDLVDIIREMREARGRFGGFKISRLGEKLQVIGPRISLDLLRSNICVRIIDRLGLSWDEYYGKLVAYKKIYRHCNVPDKWEKDRSLGIWVVNQRQRRARGQILPEHIRRLDALGFDWDPNETQWQEMYARLAAYKERHGHCNVTHSAGADLAFVSWVNTQRQFKSRNLLSPDRIERLDAVGFDWEPHRTRWKRMFARLMAYKKRHGHCGVPQAWNEDKALGSWVGNQRQFKSKGQLSRDRIRQLEAVGFKWNPKSTRWEEMYARLKAYKQKYGNCNVPDKWEKDRSLGIWVGNGRQRKERFSSAQIKLLDALGFDWDLKAAQWEDMYSRLSAYKKRYGDCNVPKTWKDDPVLAGWVSNHRQFKARRQLSQERILRLEALGFDWNPFRSSWDQMFAKLVVYRKEHGNCNVPTTGKRDRALGLWVVGQRRAKARNTLAPQRNQRLQSLGLTWDLTSEFWEKMYQQLVAYKRQHGDCNVSRSGENQQSLASWINNQRHMKVSNRLSPQRVRRLTALGLSWNVKIERWEEMFQRLARYKRQHGDCIIPKSSAQYRDLCLWMLNQRQFKSRGKLSFERIQNLNALGFDWNPHTTLWNRMYDRLAEYTKKHGGCNIPRGRGQDKPLVTWITTQRQNKANDRLSSERIRRLEALGFTWNIGEKRLGSTRLQAGMD